MFPGGATSWRAEEPPNLGSGTVATSRGPGAGEELGRSESKAFVIKSRGLINSCGTAAESGMGPDWRD